MYYIGNTKEARVCPIFKTIADKRPASILLLFIEKKNRKRLFI